MSHRCQVKIRLDYETVDDDLASCGAPASKQLGRVWMCDQHYTTFQVVRDPSKVSLACDCKKLPAE